MMTPTSGVAALETLLLDLTTAKAPRVSGVLGVATQTYWRLLASKFKPISHIYEQIILLRKVCYGASRCIALPAAVHRMIAAETVSTDPLYKLK